MSNRGTASIGSYIEFQTAVLRQLPRPEAMNPSIIEGWLGNQAVLQRVLEEALLPLANVKHVIDMDVAPYIPDGWKVESHKKQGQLELDQTKIQLYLSAEQQGDKWIKGEKLRKELGNQTGLQRQPAGLLSAPPGTDP